MDGKLLIKQIRFGSLFFTSTATYKLVKFGYTSDALLKEHKEEIPNNQQCKKSLLYKRCRSSAENDGQYL